MTTANAFSEPRRMNPRALTVVVLLHGAALTALVLAKGEDFIKPYNPPIVVTPIPEDQPPPPKPQPTQEVPPDSHFTAPPHLVDLPLPTPIPAPPAPPLPTWEGPVVGTGTLPAEEPPAPPPPPPPPPRIEPARAKANLASYVSDADYPAAAIRSEEQGTTRFRLAVGPDGRVRDCTVTGSSGSSALDSATCRIMRARARFTPARDGNGNPAPDTVANAIRWVLPDG
jgi:protein TonB